PDVVAHAAVDADVAPVPVGGDCDVLDGADLVERDGARSGDRTPRFHHQFGCGQADGRRLAAHDGQQLVGQLFHRRRIVLWQIGNAQSPTEVDDLHLGGLVDAELGDHVAQQPDHPVGGQLEAGHVEDLRADVAVQADQPQV